MTLWPIFLWRKKKQIHIWINTTINFIHIFKYCNTLHNARYQKKYENKRELMFITVCKQVVCRIKKKRGFFLLCFFILSQEMFWLGTILQTNEKYRKLLEWIYLSQLHFLQIKEHLLIQPYKVLLDMKITFGEPLQKSS